jgi:hypothetical protein
LSFETVPYPLPGHDANATVLADEVILAVSDQLCFSPEANIP